ncbi:MAG: histidinol-phosphate transaminase [Myxococcales bacterium]|nr:histidinol-phosphate transaminase [Myxococcales bacterium]
MSKVADLIRPELAELGVYAPLEGDFRIRLDANEAPALLSAGARARLGEVAAATVWERYPDARTAALREAIAARTGVGAAEVFAGVGSDEVIATLLTALTRPRGKSPAPTLVTTTPSFVMYRQSGRARGWNVLEVPLDAEWDLPQSSLVRAFEMTPPSVVFIATPNNPTGNSMSRNRLEHVIEAAAGALVVIDEAYVDYASEDHLDLYRKYDNVALLRTLSKVGFAALRVGWLVARPELVAELDKVRLPYNLPTVSQSVATTVLTELSSEIAALCATVKEERARLCHALADLPRVSLTPSQANFVWLRTERPAGEVFDALCERKILVRSFHARGGRLGSQLRVTVGTRDENDAFVQALREVT